MFWSGSWLVGAFLCDYRPFQITCIFILTWNQCNSLENIKNDHPLVPADHLPDSLWIHNVKEGGEARIGQEAVQWWPILFFRRIRSGLTFDYGSVYSSYTFTYTLYLKEIVQRMLVSVIIFFGYYFFFRVSLYWCWETKRERNQEK